MMSQKGFTLVELAIALMVIGLLIGGVLKGQELIENARITQTIREIKNLDTATMIFRNTYNALPGDIKRPNRIPNCTEEICNIPGDGNGRIEWHERGNFFPHLTKAGMIQGPVGGDQDEFDAWDSSNGEQNSELFMVQLPTGWIKLDPMMWYLTVDKQDYAAKLDAKMDDGNPDSGILKQDGCWTIGDYPNAEWDSAHGGESNCGVFIHSPNWSVPQ